MATPVTRNGRASLYVRCLVPRPLRGLIGRSEILKSLGTKQFFYRKVAGCFGQRQNGAAVPLHSTARTNNDKGGDSGASCSIH